MRVLGIDPGSWTTGWGVVERSSRRIRYVASGTIQTRGCRSFPARLQRIHEGIRSVIREWAPHAVGLEAGFVARNVQAAFRLGEARGAALVGAAGEGVEVYEYAPAAVKLAVTGSGRADKEQVGRMVVRLLGVEGRSFGKDATDALAVAVCHLHAARVSRRLGGDGTAVMRTPRRHRSVADTRRLTGGATRTGVAEALQAGPAARRRVLRRKLQ